MAVMRPARIPVTEVNPHLLCVLCGGYFIDATTIIECLHSYCRTCIVRYLETSKMCPLCDVLVHKTKPLENIRPDKTLQDLVYKLVPGLFESEMANRRKFYEEHPEECEDASLEDRGEAGLEKVPDVEDEKISLVLELCANGRPPGVPGIKAKISDRRYLLCPSAVNISHLKRFIRLKFNVPLKYKIHFYHTHLELSNNLTLFDVATLYSWRRTEPLRLFYMVHLPPPQEVQEPLSPEMKRKRLSDIKSKQERKLATMLDIAMQQNEHVDKSASDMCTVIRDVNENCIIRKPHDGSDSEDSKDFVKPRTPINGKHKYSRAAEGFVKPKMTKLDIYSKSAKKSRHGDASKLLNDTKIIDDLKLLKINQNCDELTVKREHKCGIFECTYVEGYPCKADTDLTVADADSNSVIKPGKDIKTADVKPVVTSETRDVKIEFKIGLPGNKISDVIMKSVLIKNGKLLPLKSMKTSKKPGKVKIEKSRKSKKESKRSGSSDSESTQSKTPKVKKKRKRKKSTDSLDNIKEEMKPSKKKRKKESGKEKDQKSAAKSVQSDVKPQSDIRQYCVQISESENKSKDCESLSADTKAVENNEQVLSLDPKPHSSNTSKVSADKTSNNLSQKDQPTSEPTKTTPLKTSSEQASKKSSSPETLPPKKSLLLKKSILEQEKVQESKPSTKKTPEYKENKSDNQRTIFKKKTISSEISKTITSPSKQITKDATTKQTPVEENTKPNEHLHNSMSQDVASDGTNLSPSSPKQSHSIPSTTKQSPCNNLQSRVSLTNDTKPTVDGGNFDRKPSSKITERQESITSKKLDSKVTPTLECSNKSKSDKTDTVTAITSEPTNSKSTRPKDISETDKAECSKTMVNSNPSKPTEDKIIAKQPPECTWFKYRSKSVSQTSKADDKPTDNRNDFKSWEYLKMKYCKKRSKSTSYDPEREKDNSQQADKDVSCQSPKLPAKDNMPKQNKSANEDNSLQPGKVSQSRENTKSEVNAKVNGERNVFTDINLNGTNTSKITDSKQNSETNTIDNPSEVNSMSKDKSTEIETVTAVPGIKVSTDPCQKPAIVEPVSKETKKTPVACTTSALSGRQNGDINNFNIRTKKQKAIDVIVRQISERNDLLAKQNEAKVTSGNLAQDTKPVNNNNQTHEIKGTSGTETPSGNVTAEHGTKLTPEKVIPAQVTKLTSGLENIPRTETDHSVTSILKKSGCSRDVNNTKNILNSNARECVQSSAKTAGIKDKVLDEVESCKSVKPGRNLTPQDRPHVNGDSCSPSANKSLDSDIKKVSKKCDGAVTKNNVNTIKTGRPLNTSSAVSSSSTNNTTSKPKESSELCDHNSLIYSSGFDTDPQSFSLVTHQSNDITEKTHKTVLYNK